jgi:hypothetical protein
MNYANNTDSHIYYDISVFNNDTMGSMPVNLSFSETRSGGALVENPSEYLFSIVRFELDSPTLPVFIAEPVSGSVNSLIYTFVIETVDNENNPVNVYKQQVQFVPSNNNITLPDPDTNLSSDYYFVYNYHRFIYMVNTALAALFAAIPMIERAGVAAAPYFTYDPKTGLNTLYTTQEYETTNNPSPKKLNLYWNAPTETLFSGFDTTVITDAEAIRLDGGGVAGSHINKYYKLNVNNYYNNNITYIKTGELTSMAYITMVQNYASFAMCSPIQNIVFTTSGNLPISNAQTAAPVIYSSSGECLTQGAASDISPILTDFIVPLITGTEYKPKINYNPSVYRLIDLKGNSPIKSVDLQVYWKSKIDSKLHPLVLGSQCGATCKIMFRKKAFDNL